MRTILINSAPRSIKTVYQPLFSYAFKDKINEYSTNLDINNFISDLVTTQDPFCLRETNFHTDNGKIKIPKFNKTNIDTLIIKNVHHHHLIETFLKFGCKLIGLVREPKAVLSSQLSNAKESDNDWLNATTKNDNKRENYFGYNKWKEILYLFDYLSLKYPEQVLIVKYEDLLSNFVNIAKNIVNFIGISDIDPIIKTQRFLSSKQDNYAYSVYRKDPNIDKWKSFLSDEIIDFINREINNDPIISKYYN